MIRTIDLFEGVECNDAVATLDDEPERRFGMERTTVDWAWVLTSRPYARRRARNKCIDLNVTDRPVLEAIASQAVERAEEELLESEIAFVDEAMYRRYLGNRAAWRAADLCQSQMLRRDLPADAADRSRLPHGVRQDFDEAFELLTPLQRRILQSRYTQRPPASDREVSEEMRNDGNPPVAPWRISQQRNLAEARLEERLGPSWEAQLDYFLNARDTDSGD